MKKTTLFLTFFAVLFAFQTSFAQYNYANYSNKNSALKSKVANAAVLLVSEGYELSTTAVDKLSKGESYIGTKTFYGGNEYAIIAVSEYGIEDLDIEITYGTRTITEDDDTGDEGVAIVEFYNSYDRRLKIKVKNYDSLNNYRDYDIAIIVAYK